MTCDSIRRRNLPAYAQKITFKSVCRMIDKAAYKWSKTFKIPFKDVQAEGNFLFIKAIYSYNPNNKKAKFSTFLHTVLHNGLITYGARQKHNLLIQEEHPDQPDDYNILDYVKDEKASGQYAMIEFFHSLNEDEKILVELVLDGFASTIDKLKEIATQRLNFEEKRFNDAVSNIKNLLAA